MRISWTKKKSNVEVMTAAGVQRELKKPIRQRQLNYFLGHVMRRHGLENLVVTGKVDGRRGRKRQRLKYLDSLCTCLKDKVSPYRAHQGLRGQETLASRGRHCR